MKDYNQTVDNVLMDINRTCKRLRSISRTTSVFDDSFFDSNRRAALQIRNDITEICDIFESMVKNLARLKQTEEHEHKN